MGWEFNTASHLLPCAADICCLCSLLQEGAMYMNCSNVALLRFPLFAAAFHYLLLLSTASTTLHVC